MSFVATTGVISNEPSTIKPAHYTPIWHSITKGRMDSQIRLQSWRANVRAILHQLRHGRSLDDEQLQSLHITFLPPSPIPTSQLACDHLPAFLETKDGRSYIWNLEFKRRNVIEDPEDWPLRICSKSTSYCIEECIDGLGERIWGRNHKTSRLKSLARYQSHSDYFHSDLFLTIPFLLATSTGKHRNRVAKYHVDIRIVQNGYRTCIMRQHRSGQTQLSAAEVFCLVALAVESQLENPALPSYSVSRSEFSSQYRDDTSYSAITGRSLCCSRHAISPLARTDS